MFDYKLLEALSVVAEEEGFEKAAERLFITQSAVSQRIKSLEEQEGQILISRETPPVPTEKGKILIKHYKQVKALESDISPGFDDRLLAVGINADSLATWFLPLLGPLLDRRAFSLELKVDDQDQTADMLKKGAVAGCISSSPNAVQGCRVHYLGKMDYYPVATRAFAEIWFPDGLIFEALKSAPAVIFNRHDKLHDRYLWEKLEFKSKVYPRSYIPSSEKFVDFIKMGAAYGVVPRIQIEDASESLIMLSRQCIEVPLYWHHWNIESKEITALTDTLLDRSSDFLS